MTREELFEMMKGPIIVSCQATPGEPLYDPERPVMPLMARAAKQAGAKMIRTSSVRDIIGIKEETGLPVIGLIKREYPGHSPRRRTYCTGIPEDGQAEISEHHYHGGLRHPRGSKGSL